jgi:hypothetical protein
MLKGTLFLGLGEWQRNGPQPWLLAVLGLLCLAMIGVPFSSGAGTKSMLGDAIAVSELDFTLLFGFSAVGTLLLMARFIWLTLQHRATAPTGFDRASLVWVALAALAILLPLTQMPLPRSSSGLGAIAAGLAIVMAYAVIHRRGSLTLPSVPPGDLLYLVHAARQVWTGRTRWQVLALSPRALVSTATYPAIARKVGALIWLLVCVFLLAIGLVPG